MFDSLIRDLRYQLARNNPVVRIILINVAVFILLNLLVRLILLISGYSGLMLELKFRALVSWLAFPFSLSEFIVKPWTLITSLFVHEGFFHIFWLSCSGSVRFSRMLSATNSTLHILAAEYLPHFLLSPDTVCSRAYFPQAMHTS
jgi:membrane associated rhomboid family serine protease